MSGKRKDKGRLTPFVPLLLSTIKTPAWLAMSHGAKVLYVGLRSHVPNERNEVFLSHRDAKKEVGSCRRKIAEWFRELEHYGFIVKVRPASLGVDGKGKAPLWRLTEKGCTRKTSADGEFQPPTNDFLRWDGTPFQRKTKSRLPRGCQGGDHVGASGGDTWSPLKPASGDHGGAIQTYEGGDHGVAITSLTTTGGSEAHFIALDRWGRAAEQITLEQRDRFEKIRARFDALLDPRLGAAA